MVAPPPPSHLNAFQRLVRTWDEVHPYNAAQVIRVAGAIDSPAATAAWHDAVRSLGLGHISIGDGGASYRWVVGNESRTDIAEVPPGVTLARHLTREMNRPFCVNAESPFRPFLLREAPTTWLGVVYQHWIADSVSIRAVMREWFLRLVDPRVCRTTPARACEHGYRHVFAPSSVDWRIDRDVPALFRRYLAMRRARKTHTFGALEYPVRVRLFQSLPGIVEPLRSSASAGRATVNDILLAALAETCARYVPTQHRPGRRDLAVASIADLRPHTRADLDDVFGLFLGFTTVQCPAPSLNDWPRLLASVTAQGTVARRDGLAPSSMLWLLAARAGARFVPRDRMYDFHRKEIPLAAGLSNVNLAGTWAARYHPAPLLSYVRVSPTGPVAPVVLAVTTLGDRISLTLTYREALLNEWTVTEMTRGFLDRLSLAARG